MFIVGKIFISIFYKYISSQKKNCGLLNGHINEFTCET